jgi:predicted glycosyltransferase
MSNSRSVLMYSPDSIGLGHMRRNSAIAEGLTRVMPGVSNLLLVGSSAGAYFDLPTGADCIKLPSILKTGSNEWSPKSLHVPNEVARNIRSGIIMETALALQPDVFLVDHVPSGIWDELMPSLKALKKSANCPRLVLGLRDVLGAPADIRERWEKDHIYDLIDTYYDEILIYGSPDVFPSAEAYGLGRFAERIKYCGFIHFLQQRVSKHAARENLVLGDEPLVVMTAGGGHDAYPMMHFVVEALRGTKLPYKLVIIAGPLMPAAERRVIEVMAADIGAQCIASTPKLQTYLSAADAIITMGGYNTVMESIASGVPTVVIPRTGPSAEQRCRAQLFADLDLIQNVDLEWNTHDDLLHAVDVALATPRRTFPALAFDGIANASQALARNIQQVERPGVDLEAVAA